MDRYAILGIIISLVLAMVIIPTIFINISQSTGTIFTQLPLLDVVNVSGYYKYNFSAHYNTTAGISSIILFNNSACTGSILLTSPENWNLTNGQLNITDGVGADLGNCGPTDATCDIYCTNITYYSENYIQSSTVRTIWRVFPIIIVIGILLMLLVGLGLYKIKK